MQNQDWVEGPGVRACEGHRRGGRKIRMGCDGAKGTGTVGWRLCRRGDYRAGCAAAGRTSPLARREGPSALSSILLLNLLACCRGSRVALRAALQEDRRHGHSAHSGAQQQQAGAVQVFERPQLAEVCPRVHSHSIVGQAAQQRACKPGRRRGAALSTPAGRLASWRAANTRLLGSWELERGNRAAMRGYTVCGATAC